MAVNYNNNTISLSNDLERLLTQFVDWLTADRRAVSVRLIVPRYRSLDGSNRNMPTRIQSDVITVVPIEFDNLAGSAVPAPSGGTTSVNNDNDAACSASIETEADGSLVLVLTPAQPPQDGAICNISVSDTVGGQSITTPTVDFELTADTQAANAHLDTTHMSTRPLPAPPTP